MWQKCPICNGTGQIELSLQTAKTTVCPTCRGGRIISEWTGTPPVEEQPTLTPPFKPTCNGGN